MNTLGMTESGAEYKCCYCLYGPQQVNEQVKPQLDLKQQKTSHCPQASLYVDN